MQTIKGTIALDSITQSKRSHILHYYKKEYVVILYYIYEDINESVSVQYLQGNTIDTHHNTISTPPTFNVHVHLRMHASFTDFNFPLL